MATTESRLGTLEGRADEQGAAIGELRADLRAGFADLRADVQDLRAETRAGLAAVNARIDRLYLALLGGAAAVLASQAGLVVTLILRT